MPDTNLTDDELTAIATEISTPQDLAGFMQKMTPDERTRLGKLYLTFGDHKQDKEKANLKVMGKAGVEAATVGPFIGTYQAASDILMGHPEKIVTGIRDTANKAWEGDPAAIGSVLGSVEAPFAMKGGIRLANTTGTALATSEAAQGAVNKGIGYAAGAYGAKQVGMSPFVGAYMGRELFKGSQIPIRIGKALETVTGGRAAGAPEGIDAPPTEGAVTMDAETLTRLKRQGYSPEMIDRISRGDTQGVNAKAGATARPTPLASHPTPPIVDTPSSGAFDEEWSDRLSDLDKRASGARHATAQAGYEMRPQTSPEVQELIETELNRVSKPSKVPIRDVPTTRSSSGLRAPGTPTLTVEDMNALGINPNMKITGLAPEAVKQMLVDRAKRAGVYKSSAELDALAKSIMDRDRP